MFINKAKTNLVCSSSIVSCDYCCSLALFHHQLVCLVCSFCFLAIPCRLPDLVEYIVEPLLAGLRDNSSYVRRCAVMGCVKLYHLIPDFVEGMKSSILCCVYYEFLCFLLDKCRFKTKKDSTSWHFV